jgi:hypothetical protein
MGVATAGTGLVDEWLQLWNALSIANFFWDTHPAFAPGCCA